MRRAVSHLATVFIALLAATNAGCTRAASPATQAHTSGGDEAASPDSLASPRRMPAAASTETARPSPATPRTIADAKSADTAGAPYAPARPQVPPPPPRSARDSAPAANAPVGRAEAMKPMGAVSSVAPAGPPTEPSGGEDYKDYGVNAATDPLRDRLSTFAIDVDTASYSIGRRKINEGGLPPYSAVRVEEYLNYFRYDDAPPARGPFAVSIEAAPAPFGPEGHDFVRIAVQGKRVPSAERSPVHLVYLVDVSGSMMAPDRIELAKKSLRILTDTLKSTDTVALATYAGNVREVLPPTGIGNRGAILEAIDSLTAGGSTAMASGIDLAYALASRTRVPGHVNRVVVLSDGDANVGNTSHDEILNTIRKYKDQGITLSTVGFGSGNYKDVMMERLADEGDGNYTYIDSEAQAQRVFGEQVDGLLQVIARDVKIQVEFDPAQVRSYRLIGYENRDVADKDFRNDKVDGGEVGAGHAVTAMYDVVWKSGVPKMDISPLVVRIRNKDPIGPETAKESVFSMAASARRATFEAASSDFRFATAVMGFAEVLRQSPHARRIHLDEVARIAEGASAGKADRSEFIGLVRKADALRGHALVAR